MPDAVVSLRSAENSAIANKEPSYYTGSGRNSNNSGNGNGKKGKFNKKGVGALITILMIFGGIGAFLGSSNSLLAPALSALLTSSTQTSYTSYVLRTKYITKSMLNGTGADAVTKTWTGQVKYSKIPNYMKNRLAKYDIEVTGSGRNTMLHWNGEDIDADRFITMYNENVEFRDAYSKAKRGRVANFFDNAADKLYKKLGLSRNWRANLKDTGNAETDAENLKKTLSAKFNDSTKATVNTDSEYKEKKTVYEDEIGTDGKPTGKKVPKEIIVDAHDTPSASSDAKGSDMDTAKSSAKSFLASAADSIAEIGNAACMILKVGNMIAVTVAANEIYQSINFFIGQMEGPNKMMAGYGMESGINAQLNTLTTPAHSSVTDYNNLQVSMTKGANNYYDQDPPQEEKNMAPIESPLLQKIIADAPVPASAATNYSLERAIKKMGGALLFTAGSSGVCAGINVVSNIISISSIFAGGIPAFVGNFVIKTATTVAAQLAISAVLGFMIPTIARALFTNIYETATGVISGNLLAQGAYAANSRDGRTNSAQSLSGEAAANAYNHATNTVLALEAEQDRLNHSPFDITNRNTFFGSIAYSLLPTITSTNTTGLASFLRSTTKSLSSLLTTVSATGENSSYATTYGDCPMLDEIGAKGDMFCNPIITTDVSTIELDPNDSAYVSVIEDSMEKCDDDGNCTINTDSDLARYISYCDNRDSPFGVVDQNILGAMQGDTNNAILNAIPLVGDFLDIVNSGKDLKNMDWATGQKCGNTEKNTDFWNKQGKYYQRYIEDQRILEQMGAYEDSKNPVTAYEDAYEKQYLEDHPEANTYIGYLSRISGLTPENTETMLAFVYYYNYIDQYDPTLRIAMTGDTSDVKDGEQASAEIASNIINFNNEDYVKNPIEINATERKYAAYYDIRNRSYAVW